MSRCFERTSVRPMRLNLVLLGLAWLAMFPLVASAKTVDCTVKFDRLNRSFRLSEVDVKDGKVWAVSMKSPATDDKWIELELRNYSPEVTDKRVSVKYRSPFGSEVTWTVENCEGCGASLEARIDYNSEAQDTAYKIKPSPLLAHLTTEGLLEDLECKVTE